MGINSEGSEQVVVLVAEDDPAMLNAYLQILNDAGFQVLTATNGIDRLVTR